MLENLVRQHPESAAARAGLGRLDVLLGRLAEGERHLRAAIAMDDRPLEPHLYLGLVLMQQRRCQEAVPVFRAQPDYGQAHLRLGQCLSRQSRITTKRVRRMFRGRVANAGPLGSLRGVACLPRLIGERKSCRTVAARTGSRTSEC